MNRSAGTAHFQGGEDLAVKSETRAVSDTDQRAGSACLPDLIS